MGVVPLLVGGWIHPYGDINPYTLMARLGPRDLAHYKTTRSLIHLLGVLRKETRHGDQARSWSVRIEIDIE